MIEEIKELLGVVEDDEMMERIRDLIETEYMYKSLEY